MRRIVGSAGRSLTHLGRSAVAGWDEFWFSPVDPTLLGLIRILTGSMLVYTHAVWGLELAAFFGPDGWISRDAAASLLREQYAWSYWWIVPAEWMTAAHAAALGVLVLFTLGLFTRLTSVLSFVIVVSYAYRVPTALFGLDQINGLLTLYLAIGPSGSALSLDRLFDRRRERRTALEEQAPALSCPLPPSVGANLSLRLIQVHMCVIYLFAGLSKLQGTSWWNGEAMWQAFANLEYQSADMTWLARHPHVINALTHLTIAWEVTFWALIWRPVLRPFVLLVGVGMHLGIGAFMGMWTFGLIMLVGCASFLPPDLFLHRRRPSADDERDNKV